MSSAVKLSSRSSLLDHKYPAFYACYLLKSIKTPKSQVTYVGSTPNPPKRIRQHNGEISQGAVKTRFHRPWMMAMVVHGFPSKLAALQFEWAWQHPDRSRHLQEAVGPQTTNSAEQTVTPVPRFPRNPTRNRLKTKILVVRTMLSLPPYSSWPLHVKLFHIDAVRGWNKAATIVPNAHLPTGLTVSIEFEGVDGKGTLPTARDAVSGQSASPRITPIDVKDSAFTAIQLSKQEELMTENNGDHDCTVCTESINFRDDDPLTVAICPNPSCSNISHLGCLSSAFLVAPQPSTSAHCSSLIPRGGSCPSCGEYILWGDIVRGCYRRRSRGATVVAEDEDFGADAFSLTSSDDVSTSAAREEPAITKPKRGRPRNLVSLAQGTNTGLGVDAPPPKRKIGPKRVTQARQKRTTLRARHPAKLMSRAPNRNNPKVSSQMTPESDQEEIIFPSEIASDVSDSNTNAEL